MNNATKGPWDIGVKRCKYRCLPEPAVAARMTAAGIPFEFEALSIGTDKGTVCLVPLDESNEDNAKLIVKTPELKADSELLEGLRSLMGYVQNGSETTLSLFQDDATKSFHIKVGNTRSYWGESFKEALQKAINDNKDPK